MADARPHGMPRARSVRAGAGLRGRVASVDVMSLAEHRISNSPSIQRICTREIVILTRTAPGAPGIALDDTEVRTLLCIGGSTKGRGGWLENMPPLSAGTHGSASKTGGRKLQPVQAPATARKALQAGERWPS